ncbi:MAG: M23 family metallopeptidase, partial [Actinobacteria bacterium]
MRAIRVAVLTLPAVMWLLAGAQAAAAAPWPVAGGTVLLGYGESYAVGGAVRTHLGADIAASDGACVRAPADATVAFRGSVPAGDGGTALAVSLDLADGRRVTLMPLADVVVRAGERVSAGDAIAAVAGRGDASCDEPHLHVGLKSGDTYLDPATMFEG